MRARTLVVALGGALTLSAWACGGSDSSVLDGGGDGTTNDVAPKNDTGTQDTGNQDTNPPCTDLKCARDPATSISGVVYDPAGKRTLYNVIVYVPNGTPDAITNGASCDRCGAVSGEPVTTAITDASGRFKLTNAPVGANIPLVIQIGKWRRQVVIPAVTQGVDNAVTPDLTHLPRKASEGDMPLIAIASGCDPIECSLRKFGIDDSEFTVGTGTGHVRIFAGMNASSATIGTTATTPALALWQSATDLPKYDMVLNACECQPTGPKTTAYANVAAFLDKGGRMLGSHYAVDFYAPPNGAAELQATAAWGTSQNTGLNTPVFIDEGVPKGKAYADWLSQNLGGVAGQAPIGQTSLRTDLSTTLLATSRWNYTATSADGGGATYAKYVSFNTPVLAGDAGADAALPPAQQCGRGAYLDFHMINAQGFGGTNNTSFPGFCSDYSISMTDEEYSFEFSFFELDSCVQDESKAPTAPPAVP